jgi:RNA polymerase sigma-70 factor, ECF subfamily
MRCGGARCAAWICGWIDETHGSSAAERPSPLGIRLEQLLTTLPEAQREALVLRYQEDMAPEEIALALNAPLATVKSHLQRGLKLLRAKAEGTLREFVRHKEPHALPATEAVEGAGSES